WTYAELVARVEQLSAVLAERGVREGDHVAVRVRRSSWELATVLAVLRLGAAYFAIGADVPAELAAQLTRSLHPAAIVSDRPEDQTAGDPGGPPVVPPDAPA